MLKHRFLWLKIQWVRVSYDSRIWWVVSYKTVSYRKGMRVLKRAVFHSKMTTWEHERVSQIIRSFWPKICVILQAMTLPKLKDKFLLTTPKSKWMILPPTLKRIQASFLLQHQSKIFLFSRFSVFWCYFSIDSLTIESLD